MNNYRGCRALVTGHTGFKGAWLCSWLLEDGADVAGLSLAPESGQRSLFHDLALADRLQSNIVDIRSFEPVLEAFRFHRPEIVFHLAAQALVRRSYADPIGTFASNVMGTAHVLEAARRCESVRAVVCITSDKCYDNREWVWGYRENDALGGEDPYSASKGAAEIVAGSYLRTLMPSRIGMATARGGNVIGGGDWSEDRLVPDIVRSIEQRRDLTLRNPEAVRPWQHVLELVRGYVTLGSRLLAGDETARGAWNFGPDRDNAISVGRLVETALSTWKDSGIKVRVEDSLLKESHFLRLDITKAQVQLGWQPILGFDKSIHMTLDWYRRYIEEKASARTLVAEQIAEYRAAASAAGQ